MPLKMIIIIYEYEREEERGEASVCVCVLGGWGVGGQKENGVEGKKEREMH